MRVVALSTTHHERDLKEADLLKGDLNDLNSWDIQLHHDHIDIEPSVDNPGLDFGRSLT